MGSVRKNRGDEDPRVDHCAKVGLMSRRTTHNRNPVLGVHGFISPRSRPTRPSRSRPFLGCDGPTSSPALGVPSLKCSLSPEGVGADGSLLAGLVMRFGGSSKSELSEFALVARVLEDFFGLAVGLAGGGAARFVRFRFFSGSFRLSSCSESVSLDSSLLESEEAPEE